MASGFAVGDAPDAVSVGGGHWTVEYVRRAYENGWIAQDSYESPYLDGAIARGELAQLLWSAFGSAGSEGDVPVFSDVPQDSAYYPAVAFLYRRGIMLGVGDGLFGVNDTVSRETLFTVIARIFLLNAADANAYTRFMDGAEIADWARDAISALYENGIVSGDDTGTVRPQAACSFAEIVKILVASDEQFKGQANNPFITGSVFASDDGAVPGGAAIIPTPTKGGASATTTPKPTVSSTPTVKPTGKPTPLPVNGGGGGGSSGSGGNVNSSTNGGNGTASPTPTPNPEPSPTVTPEPEPSPAVTPEPEPSPAVTPEPEPVVTPESSPVVTPPVAPTPSNEPSPATSPLPSVEPSSSPAETPTLTPTPSAAAPDIAYTVSTTAQTDNPVVINLTVSPSQNIKSVRWAQLYQKEYLALDDDPWGFKPRTDKTVLPTEISIQTLYTLRNSSIQHSDPAYSTYEGLCGGLFSIDLILAYHENSHAYIGEELGANQPPPSIYEHPELYADISKTLIGDSLEVRQNGVYYFCAEDFSGNMAIERVEVNNISQPGATVEVDFTSDFSKDEIADVKITSLSENPNARIKEAVLIKSADDYLIGGAPYRYDWNGEIRQYLLERSRFIIPIQGVADGNYENAYFAVRDFGEYTLYLLDEWGNYGAVGVEVELAAGNQAIGVECVIVKDTPEPGFAAVTVTYDSPNAIAKARLVHAAPNTLLALYGDEWYDVENCYFWNIDNREPLLTNSFVLPVEDVPQLNYYIVYVTDVFGNRGYALIDLKEAVAPTARDFMNALIAAYDLPTAALTVTGDQEVILGSGYSLSVSAAKPLNIPAGITLRIEGTLNVENGGDVNGAGAFAIAAGGTLVNNRAAPVFDGFGAKLILLPGCEIYDGDVYLAG
ncbi:MAG: S-layer homology domain-containing protein, partial [Clostridiales bacterium]|nr:S-layer homology domain-containing protein [Clostridiales bacterium]